MNTLTQWSGYAGVSLAIATCTGVAKESGQRDEDRIGDMLQRPA